MKRRINSTGRKSISIKLVSIRVMPPVVPGQAKSFIADLSGLKSLDLPPDARIYLEPYVTGSSSIMRFGFGSIASIVPPEDCALSDLDSGGRVLFRLKVVDESSEVGKILASANALRPQDEEKNEDNLRAILPVESRFLGEAIWELDMQNGARPVLVVSDRVPGFIDRLKGEAFVQGAIIPYAIRQILSAVFDVDRGDVTDDEDWVADWKQWASGVLGETVQDIDSDQLEDRIKDIVDRFIDRSRFVSRLTPGDRDEVAPDD